MSTIRDRLLQIPHELRSFDRSAGKLRILIISYDVEGVPTPAVAFERLNADGSRRAAIAFDRDELRDLRDTVEQARRLLLGADEASDDARAQEAAGLRPKAGRR